MNIDDRQRAKLRATITSLEYWIPSISDVASIAETNCDAYWRINLEPQVAGACPFEFVIRADGYHDIMIAGESFEDQLTDDVELFVPLAQAIASGNVIRRIYTTAATRMPIAIETLVWLSNGGVWQRRRELVTGFGGPVHHNTIARDHSFLPYKLE